MEFVDADEEPTGPGHAELGSFKASTFVEIPRSVRTGLTWLF